MSCYIVHCLSQRLAPLMQCLVLQSVKIVSVEDDGTDVNVLLECSKDVADAIWNAGFHVSEV